MKKLLTLTAVLLSALISFAQKPDFIRTANGPNTIVDWNLKAKTFVMPHGSTVGLYGSQDTSGNTYFRVASGDTSLNIRVGGDKWWSTNQFATTAGYVPNTRLVSTGYGLSGGGNLGSNLTLLVDTANIVTKTYANRYAHFGSPTTNNYIPVRNTNGTFNTENANIRYDYTGDGKVTFDVDADFNTIAKFTQAPTANDMPLRYQELQTINTDISSAANGLRRLGKVVNAPMNTASSSAYTQEAPNTTYTFGSSYVTSAGGSGDIDNYIYYTNYTSNSTYFSMRDTIVGVSDGEGIGLGVDGALSTLGYLIMTGADKGKIAIRTNSTVRATSTNALSYSNLTDSIELTFTRSLFTYIMTARVINDVSKTITLTWAYPYDGTGGNSPIGNAFHATIYSLGGTQHITGSHVYNINEVKQYKGLIYAHSISHANADTISWAYQAQARFSGGVNIIAGSGTRVTDYVKLKPEIFSLNPKYIIFFNGINDLTDGVPVATIFTAIKSFINDCLSQDITPIVMNVNPVTASATGTGQTNAQLRARIDSLNSLIATCEAPIKIDVYSPLVSGGFLDAAYSSTSTHPNRAGHDLIYLAVENAMKSFVSLDKFQGLVTETQIFPQTIGLTGSRLKKLWATDIEVTNPIVGSVTTNANLNGPVTSVGNTTSLGKNISLNGGTPATFSAAENSFEITPGNSVFGNTTTKTVGFAQNIANGLKVYNGAAMQVIAANGVLSVSTSQYGAAGGASGVVGRFRVDSLGTRIFNVTGNRAVVFGSTGILTSSTTTDTELGYVAGVTSGIQAQIDSKASIATSPVISSGTTAPATTPTKVGDIYVDTVAKKLYFAAGTSSSADWIIAN